MEGIQSFLNEFMPGVQMGVGIAMCVVMILLVIASIVALIVSIFLGISYIKYNRKQNSIGETGEQIARGILDNNGLENIKVSASGSVMFGNSYSHYFKKVRLRRLTYKKTSVSSMVMAAQKSSLAILDKEGDPDMRRQIKLVPLITFGPFAFVPLVAAGTALDYFVVHSDGMATTAAIVVGLIFYIFSFILSMTQLKTEKKGQALSLTIMQQEGIATPEEIEMAKKLFKLYNIEYVNNMIIALLEILYYILQIAAQMSGSGNSKSSK